uniref:Uncharacterized protein n=2 Tax=Meloidogyne TaxID=189290 RepID=A0A6V7WLL1_MELEN|nr:unnamed protein product [Meloidogyne enterolobii]
MFINLILYIFICSLQSITKNVYGVENSSNNSLKQLESTYDKDAESLTINRDKRYLNGGKGDGGGDGALPISPSCLKGSCPTSSLAFPCVPCPRPKPRHHWRRPHTIKRKHYWKPRHYKRKHG